MAMLRVKRSDHLAADHPGRKDDERARYLDLAVFAKGSVIPETALLTLWKETGSLDGLPASRLITTFSRPVVSQHAGEVSPPRSRPAGLSMGLRARDPRQYRRLAGHAPKCISEAGPRRQAVRPRRRLLLSKPRPSSARSGPRSLRALKSSGNTARTSSIVMSTVVPHCSQHTPRATPSCGHGRKDHPIRVTCFRQKIAVV